MDMVMCEQDCGEPAVVYGGDNPHDSWAGFFCAECVVSLGFNVWDKFPNGIVRDGFLRKEGK